MCSIWETSSLKQMFEDTRLSTTTRRCTGCQRWGINKLPTLNALCVSMQKYSDGNQEEIWSYEFYFFFVLLRLCCAVAGDSYSGATTGLNPQEDWSQNGGGDLTSFCLIQRKLKCVFCGVHFLNITHYSDVKGVQSLLCGPCSIRQGCPCQSHLWPHFQLVGQQDQWIFI